jgi:hypothetical protein
MRKSRIKRVATVLAGLLVGIGGVIGLAQPAMAVATCPDQHLCFYHDFIEHAPGDWDYAGTMSDQTTSVIKTDRLIFADNKWIWTKGAISDFNNSHYTNGQVLDESVSAIANNTDNCVYLFDHTNWGPGQDVPGIQLGAHSGTVLVGGNLGPHNDQLSSAFSVAPNDSHCNAARGSYKMVWTPWA